MSTASPRRLLLEIGGRNGRRRHEISHYVLYGAAFILRARPCVIRNASLARRCILRESLSCRENVHRQCNSIPSAGKWRRNGKRGGGGKYGGGGEKEDEVEKEAERRRRVRLSILQKLPRVTGPFVNEIESPVTAVPRRRNMYLLTESPRLT